MSGLYSKLKSYSKKNICPMHMPGHKRKGSLLSKMDITEIDGFDNLLNPEGVLKELQSDWATVYGAKEAYISVNGSTGAIFGAISGMCKKGDKVIMARNCHKSVYNIANLMELDCHYIYPEYDETGIAKGITEKDVRDAIDTCPDATLLVLTSPTYEGAVSEVEGICEIAHKRNISVFIDSAHGAHFAFMGMKSPIRQGADAVCVSLHKTLPSLTQTALLLLNGNRLDSSVIKEKLNLFQTSSPSYVLMASVDECLEFVENGEDKFDAYKNRLDKFYGELDGLEKLEIKRQDDIGKVVISTIKTDISGNALMKRLREDYGIELEMAYDNYALAMTSVMDTDKDFKRLKDALLEIDKKVGKGEKTKFKYPKPIKSRVDGNGETELIFLKDARGRVCAEFVWAYPPGVPIIAPGEIVDEGTILYLENINETKISGTKGSAGETIKVFKI